MVKVYVIEELRYNDYAIVGVFYSLEKATLACNMAYGETVSPNWWSASGYYYTINEYPIIDAD